MIHPDPRAWLHALDAPSPAWRAALNACYGAHGMPEASRNMLRAAIEKFYARFGDTALRVIRAPGRINLRGMHVDTHGGYLNLMSHQREVLIAFAPDSPQASTLINLDPAHPDITLNTAELAAAAQRTSWEAFLDTSAARNAIPPHGQWWHYLLGAALRAQHAAAQPLFGLRACVAGNVPTGAALSSSAALCVAAYGAYTAQNGITPSPAEWILAARDAEWFTGARTGTSDQAASVLCRPGEVCNIALLAEDFNLDTLRRVPLPKDARLLVINSCTRRSLSGAEQVAYSRNRFAYSIALHAFRSEWAALTGDSHAAAQRDRLARITTDTPEARTLVYDVLARVPTHVTLDTLRTRYDFPDLDAQYQRYFGNAAPEARPTEFDLLGPLLYGISESERARRFAHWLDQGDLQAIARAMQAGHNGDRVQDNTGNPFDRRITPAQLLAARDNNTPITELSGDYGASSPALDALVDTAQDAGALAACLTGAGIAGCVIALCTDNSLDPVRHAILQRLRAPDYPALARRTTPITEEELSAAVVLNDPPMGAGEIPWPR